jgi:hypothetical protein
MNNLLNLGLGIPTFIFAYITLTTSIFSDLASFVGIAIIGAVY